MKGDENSVGVLRLLESSHGQQSGIEVTDVRFQSVGGGRNCRIPEVREGVARRFHETLQSLKLDDIDLKQILSEESLHMMPSEIEGRRRSGKKKLAIAMDEELLGVLGMPSLVLQLELQSNPEITEKMDVTAFHLCTIGFKDLA